MGFFFQCRKSIFRKFKQVGRKKGDFPVFLAKQLCLSILTTRCPFFSWTDWKQKIINPTIIPIKYQRKLSTNITILLIIKHQQQYQTNSISSININEYHQNHAINKSTIITPSIVVSSSKTISTSIIIPPTIITPTIRIS